MTVSDLVQKWQKKAAEAKASSTAVRKRPAAAKAQAKAQAKITAVNQSKTKAKAVSGAKRVLGCAKCRGSPKGCTQCRNPKFSGVRGPR